MAEIREFLGRAACWLGFHTFRYARVVGHRDLHMVCIRCGDTRHACPYGLAGSKED